MDAAWDGFNWATRAGVEKLQDHLGVDQTGELSLGDVVFLPTAARVTALQATSVDLRPGRCCPRARRRGR